MQVGQSWNSDRIDPPWSPPMAMSHSPATTSAALPLEGRSLRIVRIEHGPSVGGMATAREAKMLAHGLADDLSTAIEEAGHNGRVHVGDVASLRRLSFVWNRCRVGSGSVRLWQSFRSGKSTVRSACSRDGDNCAMQLGRRVQDALKRIWYRIGVTRVCAICGAALKSWRESTHVPTYELVERPERKTD